MEMLSRIFAAYAGIALWASLSTPATACIRPSPDDSKRMSELALLGRVVQLNQLGNGVQVARVVVVKRMRGATAVQAFDYRIHNPDGCMLDRPVRLGEEAIFHIDLDGPGGFHVAWVTRISSVTVGSR